MSMFFEFATIEDLVEYTGKTEEELPKNVEILLKRASEMIQISMRNNYNPENEKHVEVVKLAVCAQCQNWIENELSAVSDNNIASYSLGELSVTYSNADKLSNSICMTASRYLNSQYLLYKGVRT